MRPICFPNNEYWYEYHFANYNTGRLVSNKAIQRFSNFKSRFENTKEIYLLSANRETIKQQRKREKKLINGYRCFMRSVSLKISIICLCFLALFMPNNIYAGWLSDTLESISKGAAGLRYGQDAYEKINARELKEQGVEGFFNPKMLVCDVAREYGKCYERQAGDICKHVFGAEPAALYSNTFIDWDNKIKKWKSVSMKKVTDPKSGNMVHVSQETYNGPKLCSCAANICTQHQSWKKHADIAKYLSLVTLSLSLRVDATLNVVDAIRGNFKDNEYCKGEIQCAPVPLAPGPPPFCKQLAMLPLQVRIVPITNEKNDYFDPKVKVIIGDLIGKDGEIGEKLDFPREYRKDKAWESATTGEVMKHSVLDRDGITHYFKTYREKDKLCAEYYGTEGEESKRKLQFPTRYFSAPPAPKPKILRIVNTNTLEIEMKMSKSACEAYGTYSNGFCAFQVNKSKKKVGPLSLTVVKPKIIEKTTDSSSNESGIDNIIDSSQFEILKKYGYVPDTEVRCSSSGDFYSLSDFKKKLEKKSIKCEFNHFGQPEIEVKYKDYSESKMLCLSGWKPEPEELLIEKEDKIIPLKLVGARYAKYNTVYSKESNQSYYFCCKKGENNEPVDVLAKQQDALDEIIFNKKGYISINKENKNRDNCIANKDDEMDIKQNCSKCKIVYELADGKHEEKNCNQVDDGCLCFDGVCSRSTQYVDKDDKPFYLRVSQDKNGIVTNLDNPIKASRAEVFYADKLCRFDLQNVKEKVLETIKRRVESHNLPQAYEFSGDNNYTSNLSEYGYIEIEAWGGGEAGHIKGKAHSTESRPGMPGGYIKVQLKVDSEYPIIKVKATEGGGGWTEQISNKDGGSTWIEMCDSLKQNCKPLITVIGGGEYKKYGDQEYKKTKIHGNLGDLKVLGNPTVIEGKKFTGGNQRAYIRDGKIKLETVECRNAISDKHGAGGCIDTNGKIYDKGSPGYVIIKSVKIDYEEIKEIISTLIENPDSNNSSDLIKELYPDIIKEIKEEIKKELLGKRSLGRVKVNLSY